jgi:hypothetical protein
MATQTTSKKSVGRLVELPDTTEMLWVITAVHVPTRRRYILQEIAGGVRKAINAAKAESLKIDPVESHWLYASGGEEIDCSFLHWYPEFNFDPAAKIPYRMSGRNRVGNWNGHKDA